MVLLACLALTFLHPGLCFQGEWRAANFKLGSKNSVPVAEGKRVSMAESVESDLEAAREVSVEPPTYQRSVESLGSLNSARSARSAKSARSARSRVESLRMGLKATTVRATRVAPGEIHVEMLPVYGVRYESMSQGPAPST